MKYIVTLDSGTTSCRTLLVDRYGKVVSMAQKEFTQYFPQSGWVEHDPIEIWNTQLTTLQNAKHKAGIKSDHVAALGITNQRETVVLWDKETGLPVYNAIVWQDRRTSAFCDQLIAKNYGPIFQQKTGLIINPYFSGTKIQWILKNVSAAQKVLSEGKLLAGTIDTWLIWKLTNGAVHATDVSNASRTLLFNIHTLDWDDEILKLLEIPRTILPKVHSSSDPSSYGTVAPEHWSKRAKGVVPITGVIGDQQSALFGQLCVEPGMVKNTYGTGCFCLVNTGTKPVKSDNQLLTTVAWKIGSQPTVYALEGSVFVAGAAIQWLRDGLKMIYDARETEFLASIATDEQNVYVVPAFTGLGAPYWDSYARGAIFGLERSTKKEHMVKATLESIAFQSYDLIKSMENDLKQPIVVLKVDGGASNSNYLMQFQSSITNLDVVRLKNTETTAMGASYLAGLAVGYYESIEQLKKISEVDQVFHPKLSPTVVAAKLKGWRAAVGRTLNWVKEAN